MRLRDWFKSKKAKAIAMLGCFAMLLGVGASVSVASAVKENEVVETKAATDNYGYKVYLEVTNDCYGNIGEIKSVWAHCYGGASDTDVKMSLISGYASNNRKFQCILPSGNTKFMFALSTNSDSITWTKQTGEFNMIGVSSAARWYTWWASSGNWYNFSGVRNRAVDNGTTTCTLTGDYIGLHANDVTETSYNHMICTVSNIPDTKEATLGQYSDASCTELVSEYKLSSGTYEFTSWVYNADYYFQPILYDRNYVSVNGGSTWTALTCDDLTASSLNYRKSGLSLTADNEVRFKHGSSGSSLSYSVTIGSNVYGSSSPYHIKNSGTGDILLNYDSGTYTATIGKISAPSSGHFVFNITTGSFYGTTDGDAGKKPVSGKPFISKDEKLELAYSNGTTTTPYAINSLNSYSTSGAFTFSGGTITCNVTNYYFIEIQQRGGDWDIVYAEAWGFTLTFNNNGHGTAPDSTIVEKGTTATEPTAPTAEGYTFRGWYKEAGCVNAWNFGSDTVTANTTLYAKWELNSHTLTWDFDGGTPTGTYTSGTVSYGTTITYPTSVSKDGHDFDHWSSEPTTMPDSNLTITAVWISGEDFAIEWATNFNGAIRGEDGGVCKSDGSTTISSLVDDWADQSTAYAALAGYKQYWLAEATKSGDSNVTTALAQYDYVCGKYGPNGQKISGITDFLGRDPKPKPSSAGVIPGTPSSNQSPLTTTLWIVLGAGVLGLGAIGTAYFVSKKKKKHQA